MDLNLKCLVEFIFFWKCVFIELVYILIDYLWFKNVFFLYKFKVKGNCFYKIFDELIMYIYNEF